MTIHGAKGMEFKHVFIPGFEDKVIPHKRASERGVPGIDEERRLAYVALTRAKEHCRLSVCDSRKSKPTGEAAVAGVEGNVRSTIPAALCPYLREIPTWQDLVTLRDRREVPSPEQMAANVNVENGLLALLKRSGDSS
jgi:superfamily I DNA/RNA helicase